MRSIALVVGLLALQTYPPPFPRVGATKLLENDRVTVWDLVWKKGEPTPMHRHDLDLLGVIVEQFHLKGTFPDGSSRPGQPLKAGDALFQSKGMVHIEESLIDVSRAIGIELKDGPVSPSNVPAEVPKAFPRDAATLLLDNDRVTVWSLRWPRGQSLPPHVHDRDTIVVPIESETTGPSARKPVFTARNQTHSDEAVEGSSRAVIVELK